MSFKMMINKKEGEKVYNGYYNCICPPDFYTSQYGLLIPPGGESKVAEIVSQPTPLAGKEHRSSQDFTIPKIEPVSQYGKTPTMIRLVFMSSNPNARYDVMRHHTIGYDEMVFPNVSQGSNLVYNISYSGQKWYIANPNGVSQPFTVTVSAVGR